MYSTVQNITTNEVSSFVQIITYMYNGTEITMHVDRLCTQ